jgi:hypothetical protein
MLQPVNSPAPPKKNGRELPRPVNTALGNYGVRVMAMLSV